MRGCHQQACGHRGCACPPGRGAEHLAPARGARQRQRVQVVQLQLRAGGEAQQALGRLRGGMGGEDAGRGAAAECGEVQGGKGLLQGKRGGRRAGGARKGGGGLARAGPGRRGCCVRPSHLQPADQRFRPQLQRLSEEPCTTAGTTTRLPGPSHLQPAVQGVHHGALEWREVQRRAQQLKRIRDLRKGRKGGDGEMSGVQSAHTHDTHSAA